MNIEDQTLELGFNLSTNVIQPAPGDLIVVKVSQLLTVSQREMFTEMLKPALEPFGCKFLVLEGGADIMLVKKTNPDGC